MALLESKKALIEAINADIVNNGKKGITGDTLNLILNSIVELMGTGSGGGGNVYNIPTSLTTASSSSPYTFTTEEADAFKAAVANLADTTIGLHMAEGVMSMRLIFAAIQSTEEEGAVMYELTAPMSTGSSLVPMTFHIGLLADGTVMGYYG